MIKTLLTNLLRNSTIKVGFIVFGVSSCAAQNAANALVAPKVGDSVMQHFKTPPRDGEFRGSSAPGVQGIACVSITSPGITPPSGSDYGHCLRLRTLKLGDAFYVQQIELARLKTIPEQNIVQPRILGKTPEGITTVVIPVSALEVGGEMRMQSYLVALFDSAGIVQTLQLTGKPSDASSALPFSGITLGTPKQQVADVLGLPSSVTDVQQIRGKLWDYAPFPFTIELVNDIVYSIRIERPKQNNQRIAFTPLSSLPE